MRGSIPGMEATCCHIEVKLADGDAQATDTEVPETKYPVKEYCKVSK